MPLYVRYHSNLETAYVRAAFHVCVCVVVAVNQKEDEVMMMMMMGIMRRKSLAD